MITVYEKIYPYIKNTSCIYCTKGVFISCPDIGVQFILAKVILFFLVSIYPALQFTQAQTCGKIILVKKMNKGIFLEVLPHDRT